MRILAASTILFLSLGAIAEQPATPQVVRLSEPVQVTDTHEIFGAPIGELGEPRGLAEIIAAGEQYLDQQVYVTARVEKVCQKKGCFFIAQDGAAVARVTFVDYSFFVPTDSPGKQVAIVGTFSRKNLDEAQAKHYASDAGADPARVTGPRSEYAIVATAVAIPRS